jgi:hypothetical protein
LTTANEGMLTVETFRKVMFAAQIKLGKLTSKLLPLELMLTEEVMLAIWVLKVFSLLLLSISSVATLSKLIPSRVLKNVLEMVTLVAFLMAAESCGRAGRAVQAMVLTDASDGIERVERRVRLFIVKAPPIAFRVVDPRLVRPPALLQVKSPVICCGPSMLMTPAALVPTTMLPEMVEQEANCEASAWELMVAVA